MFTNLGLCGFESVQRIAILTFDLRVRFCDEGRCHLTGVAFAFLCVYLSLKRHLASKKKEPSLFCSFARCALFSHSIHCFLILQSDLSLKSIKMSILSFLIVAILVHNVIALDIHPEWVFLNLASDMQLDLVAREHLFWGFFTHSIVSIASRLLSHNVYVSRGSLRIALKWPYLGAIIASGI